jgi:phosphoglycolate phosphatase-like HAD superfamily hydrolase
VGALAPPTVVLDLDGTVWDSRPWYAQLIGHDDPAQVSNAQARLASGASAARLLKEAGYTQARFKVACRTAEPPFACFPGIMHALEQLRDYGVKLGAATSLPGWIARPMADVSGITPLLTTLVDYGATSRHKPRPDPLLEALLRLNTEPGQGTWYVGDGHEDAAAAHAGGLQFAWASWGTTSEVPEGVNLTLREPADLTTLAGLTLEEALWSPLSLPGVRREVPLQDPLWVRRIPARAH